MKKILSVILALAMVLSMTTAFAASDGKLTIWTWDPTFNIAAMNIAKEMYQAEHPDVEIEIVEVLSDDIETKVITAATAHDLSNLPDIMLCQDNSFQKMVSQYEEVYMDLTGKYDYEGFGAAKVAYSVIDGKNYGIPFDAGTVVGAWRTDDLAKAGVTADDLNNITWEQFLEVGRKVKEATGMPMLSGQAGSTDTILIMLQSCGSSMFNEDGSVNLAGNAELKTILDVYITMVKEGIFLEVNTWDEYIGTLSNHSVVGTINGCWILATIMKLDSAGQWALTNMPSLPVEGATNYSNNGGSSWAITNGTDTDLALDFMQLYRNVEFLNAILPTTSAIATYAPAKEGAAYSAGSDFFNGEPIFATILEYGTHVPSNYTGAFYYEARNALGTAKTNIMNGGDIESELQTADDTINFAMGF